MALNNRCRIEFCTVKHKVKYFKLFGELPYGLAVFKDGSDKSFVELNIFGIPQIVTGASYDFQNAVSFGYDSSNVVLEGKNVVYNHINC